MKRDSSIKKYSYIFAVICVVFFSGCKEEIKTIPSNYQIFDEHKKEMQPIPNLVKLSPKTQEIITSWEQYTELKNSFEKFIIAKDKNEYSFLISELLEKEKQLSLKKIPEQFNVPNIKSRIVVFKTYLLETEALLKETHTDSLKMNGGKIKLVNAFNALQHQFDEVIEDESNVVLQRLNDSTTVKPIPDKIEDVELE